jgi:hypothetical protein
MTSSPKISAFFSFQEKHTYRKYGVKKMSQEYQELQRKALCIAYFLQSYSSKQFNNSGLGDRKLSFSRSSGMLKNMIFQHRSILQSFLVYHSGFKHVL